ncbi:MAG: hypothetical protein IIX15_02130 [Clostridia bacterium]|nr:hypothetical protein [Clostridia bacterium]
MEYFKGGGAAFFGGILFVHFCHKPPLEKTKNIFQKGIDKRRTSCYNTEEKEAERAVLTLPHMARTGRYRKYL